MSNRMRDGLVKRGSTWSFVLRVPDPQTCGTKPKWHGRFRTREEAKAERDAARAALRAGTYVPPSRRTLAEFVDEWLPAVRTQVSENT